MIDDRFGNPPGTRLPPERDPDQLYATESEYGRSNMSVGLIVGAILVLGVLIYAFGWKVDDRTVESSGPVTTGENISRPAPGKPAATPGPVTPAPSTTGSGSAQPGPAQ